MKELYDYIEQNQEIYLSLLEKFCNQPSISIEDVGMEDMAELVKETLIELGAKVELISTAGYPVVFGEIDNQAAKTILFYNHYDVQPVDPLEQWESDPFKTTRKDGRMFARGVVDNKGTFLARICAIDAYQKTYGKLPVNLKFMVEGEEEAGSPNLEKFITSNEDKLQCDGLIWEGGSRNIEGPLQVGIGVKGLSYIELRTKGPRTDLHSKNAGIVTSPVWRLVWALNTLKNENEEILIEGFYDDVVPMTQDDYELLKAMPYDEAKMKESWGIDYFANNLTGVDLKKRLLYECTCNICGLVAGYTKKGSKAILPSEATAKLDFRLVYNQNPEKIADLVRSHLDKHGFQDIEVEYLKGEHPFSTDINNPLAKAVLNSVEKIYDAPPVVYKNQPGTSPLYIACNTLNAPAVIFGAGHDASQIHAPNENMYIKDFINCAKLTATVLETFSKE